MFCLDRWQDLRFWGSTELAETQFLTVGIKRCQKDTCKSQSEIDEFLKNDPLIIVNFNEQKYRPNAYDEEVIQNSSSIKYFPAT